MPACGTLGARSKRGSSHFNSTAAGAWCMARSNPNYIQTHQERLILDDNDTLDSCKAVSNKLKGISQKEDGEKLTRVCVYSASTRVYILGVSGYIL